MSKQRTNPRDERAMRWRHAPAALVLVASGAFAADGVAVRDEVNPFSQFSDEQLSDLGGRWEAMGDEERRWYFVEMRKRMAASGEPTRIPVRARARFGRILEDAGALLGVETLPTLDDQLAIDDKGRKPPLRAGMKAHALQTAPAATTLEDATPERFGAGFERRKEPAPDPDRADAGADRKSDGAVSEGEREGLPLATGDRDAHQS